MAAADADEYLDGPLLTPGVLEDRAYQTELAATARKGHTLVCLPTGLGKTTVSCLVTASRLADHGGIALLLAPTKPLVQQHADFYRDALAVPDDEIVVFTGDVRPDDRAALWESARVVLATPQVIENDLVGNRIALDAVTHCTFDECHRATGDYAYNYIADRYHADADRPLVTGMSASPGGDKEEILRVCENLGLDEVAVRTEADADVAAHTYRTDVDWQHVDLPEDVLAIRDALNEVITDRLTDLKELGVVNSTDPNMSQKQLNTARGRLQRLMNEDDSAGYEGMSAHAEVMKLRRATELVETQSVESLRRYFERQREQARSSGASKASQRFVSEPRVKKAMRLAEEFDGLHPKFRETRILLAETFGLEGGSRAIVFTESRDTAETLTDFLNESFDARRFVGQGDKEGSDGMTQTEQTERLDAFRAGEFEVLVSTSVAEEGLDVPDVDLVVFYEPVPKGIRSVQRKGRTGRASEGKVVVLIADDTRDEAFFWMSRNEEKRMEEELRKLKGMADEVATELEQGSLDEFDGDATASGGDEQSTDPPGEDDETEAAGERASEAANRADTRGQAGLDSFGDADGRRPEQAATDEADDSKVAEGGDDADAAVARAEADADGDRIERAGTDADGDRIERAGTEEEAVEVVADQRELDSTIARDLSTREGIETRLETLAVGDYVLSDRVVVERKTTEDFLDTLLGEDRSMFEQVGDAVRSYARPVVIVEGDDLYGRRNVHPNAIRGALASLAVDFGASVLFTDDEDATTELLETIARREQESDDREVRVHGEKSSKTLAEQQEYVVGSIAEVGPVTARALLEQFGSVERVMTADEEALLDVEGVGPVTAERLREVVGSDYDG